jgi:ribosome-associated heat shock protein Hsp15
MAGGVATPGDTSGPAAAQRLDKWLWYARIARTRTQAAALVTGGKIRVNRVKTDKPAHAVKVGDVITASLGPRVRVLAVRGLGERRGSAEMVKALFDDLSAPAAAPGGDAIPGGSAKAGRPGQRGAGAGRPTKRDRRLIDRLKGEF